MKCLIFVLYLFLNITRIFASESCGRLAVINFQTVLVDSTSSLKGEGLRPYLSNEPRSLELLNTYQENAKPSLKSSFLSTLGFTMSILSLTVDKDKTGVYSSRILLTTGISLIIVNFLFNKTMQHNNEANLKQAIDYYNSKNKPIIYFSPYSSSNPGPNELDGNHIDGLEIGITKGFE